MDSNICAFQELDSVEIANSAIIEIEQLSTHWPHNNNNFTVLTENIRSIYSNFDDFQIALAQIGLDVDVVILTECRLNSNKPIPVLNNYASFYTSNHLNQNDGVVAYVRNCHLAQVTEIIISHASALQIIISNFTIIGIYRSPSNVSAENFINSLDIHLESIHTHKNVIITGDININLIERSTEPSHVRTNRVSYLNMTSVHGFLPGHSLPTRGESCLDHMILKLEKIKNSASVVILNTTITDHSIVLLNVSHSYQTKDIVKCKKVTNFKKAYSHLVDTDISVFNTYNDPNYFADFLIEVIRKSLLLNTQTHTVSCSKRILKPWISTGALRCIRLRNNMQSQLKKDPHNIVRKITYKRFRTFCSNLIKKLKRQYHKEQIACSIKNPKKLWRNINNITHYKKPKSSNVHLLQPSINPLDSLNRINQFFATIGKILAEEIMTQTGHMTHRPSYSYSHSQITSFVLLETDSEEVNGILMALDSESASGWDGIPSNFLKLSKDFVVPLICRLANLCFTTGTFPTALKRSLITPVHKGGGHKRCQ